MENKLTIEAAQAEVTKWLDHKKISNSKRETLKEVFDELVETMLDGYLILDQETFELTYTLKFTPDNSELSKLVFKPRVSAGVIEAKLKNIGTEVNARIRAYASAITGNPANDFRVLDTADLSIVSNIVAWFF